MVNRYTHTHTHTQTQLTMFSYCKIIFYYCLFDFRRFSTRRIAKRKANAVRKRRVDDGGCGKEKMLLLWFSIAPFPCEIFQGYLTRNVVYSGKFYVSEYLIHISNYRRYVWSFSFSFVISLTMAFRTNEMVSFISELCRSWIFPSEFNRNRISLMNLQRSRGLSSFR